MMMQSKRNEQVKFRLGISKMYSDLELETMVQDLIDGTKSEICIYLSDAGYGRFYIGYDEYSNLYATVGNQTTPDPKYLWNLIK